MTYDDYRKRIDSAMKDSQMGLFRPDDKPGFMSPFANSSGVSRLKIISKDAFRELKKRFNPFANGRTPSITELIFYAEENNKHFPKKADDKFALAGMSYVEASNIMGILPILSFHEDYQTPGTNYRMN